MSLVLTNDSLWHLLRGMGFGHSRSKLPYYPLGSLLDEVDPWFIESEREREISSHKAQKAKVLVVLNKIAPPDCLLLVEVFMVEYFDPLIAAAKKRVEDGILFARHEDMDACLQALVEQWGESNMSSHVDTATVWCRDPDDTPAWAQGWTNSEAGGTMEDDLKYMGAMIHWTVARRARARTLRTIRATKMSTLSATVGRVKRNAR